MHSTHKHHSLWNTTIFHNSFSDNSDATRRRISTSIDKNCCSASFIFWSYDNVNGWVQAIGLHESISVIANRSVRKYGFNQVILGTELFKTTSNQAETRRCIRVNVLDVYMLCRFEATTGHSADQHRKFHTQKEIFKYTWKSLALFITLPLEYTTISLSNLSTFYWILWSLHKNNTWIAEKHVCLLPRNSE